MSKSNPRLRRPLSAQRMFLVFLAVIAPMYLVLAVNRSSQSGSSTAAPHKQSLYERCLGICRAYGLIATGDIEVDADAYLAAVDSRPLSGSLQQLLADPEFRPAKSQQHALLGRSAPAFTLPDHLGNPQQLADYTAEGPVVVVFYYGYWCSHCVAQLFALDRDLAHFSEMNATVVAISADPPEQTTARFVEYGTFGFPVLSDDGNRMARAFGAYRPADDGNDEQLDHATYVVGKDGQVVWAYQGAEPFVDNRTLLAVLAEMQGRMPAISAAEAP